MTGPEFAAAHGDSSTWTTADFETELNLAEIDAHKAAASKPHPVRRILRAVVYLLHTAAFLTAAYATYQATAPHLPTVPIVDANAASFAALAAALIVCFALDPAASKAVRALTTTREK